MQTVTKYRKAIRLCHLLLYGLHGRKGNGAYRSLSVRLRETDRAFCGFSILAQSRKSHEAIQWKNEEMSKSGNLQRIFKRCVQVLFIYRGGIRTVRKSQDIIL